MDNIQAQGFFDFFKLFSKENIEKVNKILDSIEIQELENGATRIIIDIHPKKN